MVRCSTEKEKKCSIVLLGFNNVILLEPGQHNLCWINFIFQPSPEENTKGPRYCTSYIFYNLTHYLTVNLLHGLLFHFQQLCSMLQVWMNCCKPFELCTQMCLSLPLICWISGQMLKTFWRHCKIKPWSHINQVVKGNHCHEKFNWHGKLVDFVFGSN